MNVSLGVAYWYCVGLGSWIVSASHRMLRARIFALFTNHGPGMKLESTLFVITEIPRDQFDDTGFLFRLANISDNIWGLKLIGQIPRFDGHFYPGMSRT